MKLSKERVDYIRDLISTVPPVTLTITEAADQTWVVSAFIGHIAGTNVEKGCMLSAALGMSCRMLGVEEGVDAWIEALNMSRDKPLPKFIKPLLIHHFNHIAKEHGKKKE